MSRKYPALWLLAAVTSGIVIADLSNLPAWLWLLAAMAATVVGAIRACTRYGVAALLASLALLSAFQYAQNFHQPGARQLGGLVSVSRVYRVYAQVADWPKIRTDRTDITLDVDSLTADRRYVVDGRLLLTVTTRTTALQRGDRVAFTARIYPVETYSPSPHSRYDRYLRLQGIAGRTYLPTLLSVHVDRRSPLGYVPVIDAVRTYIVSVLEQDLTPEAAALAKGYLLGETRDIPTDIYEMFRDSGTLHLLAVSGSNVALVLAVCHLLMRPLSLSRGRRNAAMLMVLAAYAGLCYFEPSVIRASLMAALLIIARTVRRNANLNQVIALAASCILLVDPAQFFDIGFQLSFATAWGLVFIVPRLIDLFAAHRSHWWYRWAVFPLIVALVAQLVSTPLIVYYFHAIPLLSVPANLIVIPLVSLGVMGVVVVPLVHLILPILGQFAGSLVDPLLRLVVVLLHWMRGPGLPVFHMERLADSPWTLPAVIAAYTLLVMATVGLTSRRIRRTLVFVVLSIALLLVGLSALDARDTQTTLSVEPVPGGTAVLIRDRSGIGDLIITSAIDRSYPLDQRVFQPMLLRRDVNRLRSMVVLDAPFGAVDDLLRLATANHVQRVLIHRSLRSSFADVVAADSAFGDLRIDEFSGPLPNLTAPGLAAGDDGILVQLPGLSVLIVDRLPDNLPEASGSKTTALVIGTTWTPAPDDWVRLRLRGFDLIAARSVRVGGRERTQSSDPDYEEIPPDYVCDLKRLGTIELHANPPDPADRPPSGRFNLSD
ncbi:MAG: ComEC/Rec2 family competence protein [candidate division Zixibacteria bacterium]|jgi:ComEC/Rec2-related protein|nr:ComEC/Rec2 family competence protein [candidate division Zixibacteria bacterium]